MFHTKPGPNKSIANKAYGIFFQFFVYAIIIAGWKTMSICNSKHEFHGSNIMCYLMWMRCKADFIREGPIMTMFLQAYLEAAKVYSNLSSTLASAL